MLKTEKLYGVILDSLLLGHDYSLQSYVSAWWTASLPTNEAILTTNIDKQEEGMFECCQQIPSSVASVFILCCIYFFFLALERQENRGCFEKLQKKPIKASNCWIDEFMLILLCLNNEECCKITTIRCFSVVCIFSAHGVFFWFCLLLFCFHEKMCWCCRVGDVLLPTSWSLGSLRGCLIDQWFALTVW